MAMSKEDKTEYATKEACGTYALALNDYLDKKGIKHRIVTLGNDERWDDQLGGVGYKQPDRLKWKHFNHVAIEMGNKLYDIEGVHAKDKLADRYDANGLVVVDREQLKKHMGGSSKMPLYFDKKFYSEVMDGLQKKKEGAWAQKSRIRVGDLPKNYSTDAKDFISPDYFDEDDEGTMYHVTTAKDKVIGEGLKSRSDTKSVGLGGGFNNQASDKVSVTFSNPQAQAIAERLRLAVDAAKGNVKSSDVLSIMVEDYRLDDEYPPKEIVDVLCVPSKISNDWDKVGAWVDKEYDPYDVLVKLDDSLSSIFTDAGDFGYRVGLTGTKEQMARIPEDQIEIMEIGAKKGVKPEHVADEAELRFNPQDIWVIHKGRGKKGQWAVIYAPMPLQRSVRPHRKAKEHSTMAGRMK
jgi:hypothetical protein